MSATSTLRPGAVEPVDIPDPLRPIPRPPRNVSRPASYQRELPPISEADAAAEDELFTAPTAPTPKPQITLATTVQHRGRLITIQATDMTADQFCDLLDRRGFAAPEPTPTAAPVATPDDLPDGWKLCRKHGAPMRPRNKQNEHWHSHNVGTKDNPIWCKGYRGADSPGYEL